MIWKLPQLIILRIYHICPFILSFDCSPSTNIVHSSGTYRYHPILLMPGHTPSMWWQWPFKLSSAFFDNCPCFFRMAFSRYADDHTVSLIPPNISSFSSSSSSPSSSFSGDSSFDFLSARLTFLPYRFISLFASSRIVWVWQERHFPLQLLPSSTDRPATAFLCVTTSSQRRW